MEPLHWAWRRERAIHHSGAVRSYTRDIDFCEPRGPHESPRGLCDDCTMLQMIQEVVTNEENGNNSWFLSSSSDESFNEGISSDGIGVKDARFSMKGSNDYFPLNQYFLSLMIMHACFRVRNCCKPLQIFEVLPKTKCNAPAYL